MTFRLVLDPIACDGHGICAELFPEGIRLDDWGYPILAPGDVPHQPGERMLAAPRPPARSWPSRSTVGTSGGVGSSAGSVRPNPAGTAEPGRRTSP